ncbi:pyridoxal kinase PdxY [Rhodospirillum centenum]|uniref:Pyridoxal kinase PdxY n=1 Tax=Rhodospirillum centenum (strain ATCC 51521 / SW) TaxID=414684 RepID=B6IY99_RHOCS|nr:pyridoxal kinase PdxY [Rhodospirillum centenum]ACJ01273.1 Pyridoxamine kinase [Rhodospirillum centenum SW]
MKTILTIQSHVAFGHVGNRAAVFPLERLGCEAIAVNTVQFSNHTGYGAWTGTVFPPDHVAEILAGVEARGGLAGCDAVLTGYMGDAALGAVVLDAVVRVKALNRRAVWCCDPVMGDVGRGFFVRPGIPEFFRDRAVPLADVITPNQFELEYLSGRAVDDLAGALEATAAVRALGPRLALVTSLARRDAPADRIEMLLDTPDGAWIVATPRLDLSPPANGAGDATAALFLAKLLETGSPAEALGHAASAIYAVFTATAAAGRRELQLIAAQEELVRPRCLFTPEKVR